MSCNNSSSQESKKTCKKNKALKKYNILGQTDKQQIIESLQGDSSLEMYQTLSEKYNTSIKNLRRWYQDGIARKPGCGRKKLNTKAEEELREWIIKESVELRRRVRRSQLKQKAIELFNIPNFKASKAWQDEFIRNFDIKYQVNEILYNKGILNQLQKVKFEEQRRKRQQETKIDQMMEIPSSQISTDKKKEIIFFIIKITYQYPYFTFIWQFQILYFYSCSSNISSQVLPNNSIITKKLQFMEPQ